MLKRIDTPTLVLSLVIAATAFGVFSDVDTAKIHTDIVAIETPDLPSTAHAGLGRADKIWWDMFGYITDKVE